MRKIEQQMRDAAFALRPFRCDNTEVRIATHAGMPVAEVFLHGNHIANVFQVHHDTMNVEPIRETFRKWPTTTTCSRLCALGVAASIKKGAATINGKVL